MKLCRELSGRYCLLVSVLVVLSGCGSTYTVTPNSGTGDYSYNDINAEFLDKAATIEMVDGREVHADHLRVDGDTLSWNEEETGIRQKAAANDVIRILRRNHLLGGIEGLAIGAVTDGALLLGLTASPSHEFPIAGAMAAIALPPAVITLGLIMGHRYEYRFSSDSTRTKH